MSFWLNLLGITNKEKTEELSENSVEEYLPEIRREETSNTLDLGWYWSENKEEFQLAKIPAKDRATHLYVIGATGTGKTKFLEYLVQQDIEKGNGAGIIDPHGDLIEDIKGFLACRYSANKDEKEISENVILIDPTDPKFTVTFNPLEKLPNISAAEQAGELISAFKKIWADSWGSRMEDLLRNSLISLGEAGHTLAELPRFLTNRSFREIVLEKVDNPISLEYFKRFDSLTDKGQLSWIEPVMNKINAFFADERIRQMFSSAKSSFNLREIMDKKKLLLIKLDKGQLKGAADLLGSLLMAKIQMAAFSRADLPQNKRVPFYLYIDEFQNYASESFSVILSEARKYGLSLVMAHQTLAQISDELRSLILGNAGIQVYFRINRQDANLLAKEAFNYSGFEVKTISSHRPIFWSFSEEWEHKIEELQNLSPRVCYVKHKIEGGIIPIRTSDIEPAYDILGMEENEYPKFLENLPIGRKYLVSRETLVSVSKERNELIKKEIEKKQEKEKRFEPVQEESKPQKPKREPKYEVVRRTLEFKETKEPEFEEKERTQHQYLQNLIKKSAEEKGYRAVIEQPTPDGKGRVDVSLERETIRIACEISITSTSEQELSNIEKCLQAGYEKIVLCSPEKKVLEKLRTFILKNLDDSAKEKVLFFLPEDLLFYLEEEAAREGTKEERVKGYRVKVQYQPVRDMEKKTKREAVGQVIVQALRRLKGK